MKKFFGQQIIEAPRHNSDADSAKARHYGRITQDDEGYDYDGFTRFPVSRKQEGYNKRLGYKSFTDKLGPLKQYLLSSCGRLWDDVYSEIAYNLGRFTKKEGIRHIISQHLDVATNTYRGVDGNVWVCGKYGVKKLSDSYDSFYVEPETGILRLAPPREPWPGRKPNPDIIQLPGSTRYERIKGVWYYIEYVTVEKSVPGLGLFGKTIYQTITTDVIEFKRQLGKKELKELRKMRG